MGDTAGKTMFETEQELLSRIDSAAVTVPRAEEPVPDHLALQWHITDRCNLKCTHCYIGDSPLPELAIEKLYPMVENYVSTLKRMNTKGSVHVTGGEPFMRRDLFEFLGMLRSHREIRSFAVMCNGTMIDQDIAQKLARSGCEFVQVSLDGGEKVHDSIRGKGSFSKAILGIRLLSNRDIPVSVSFTAGKNNFMEFGAAVEAALKAGAVSFWSDRVIPAGRSSSGMELMNDNETVQYFTGMNDWRKKLEKKLFKKAGVSMNRALQFMFYDGEGPDCYPYRCTAGRTVLTVLADGRVVPCRRMPVIVGDFKTQDLHDIYNNSVLLKMLRNPVNIPSGCGSCTYAMACNGGLKCLSCAVYGNPFVRDPQCTDVLLGKSINKLQPGSGLEE